MIEKSIPLVIILGLLLCYFFAPKIFWWVVRGLVTGFDQMVTRLANSAFLRFFCGQKKTRSQKDTDEWTANLLHHLEKQKAGSEGGNETREPAKSTEPLTPPSEPETPAEDGGNEAHKPVNAPEPLPNIRLKGEAYKIYFWSAVAVNVFATLVTIFLIVASVLSIMKTKTIIGGALAGSIVLLTILFIFFFLKYTLDSLEAVPENRLAMLLVFGRHVKNLSAGPVYAPKWISEIVHVSTEQQEDDVPADPRKIFYGDPNEKTDGRAGDGKVPAGFTPALRLTLREKRPEGDNESYIPTYEYGEKDPNGVIVMQEVTATPVQKGSSLLKSQNVSVELSFAFVVNDLLTFYRKVGSIKKAKKIMHDHVMSGVSAELPKLCPIEVNLFLKYIAESVRLELSEFTKEWGITVTLVRMKAIGFSHEFNTAQMKVASAAETADMDVIVATGKANSRRLAGAAEGDYERDILKGRAEGMKEIVAASMIDGGRALAIQSIAEALGKSTLIATDPSNLLGAVAGASKVLQVISNQEHPVVPTDKSGDQKPEAVATVIPTATPKKEPEPKSRGSNNRRRR